MRAVRNGLLIVGLALLLIEAGLQVASLFAQGRATPLRSGAHYTVLCVGDSHTYGAGVEDDATYPAHLGRLLDREAPDLYSVVNVGVPGMNIAQVRERLPDFVRRYDPDLILVWVGINNSWNLAGQRGESNAALVRLDRLAGHARIYRLARTWLHDRRLDRDRVVYTQGRAWEIVRTEGAFTGKDRITLRRHDGVLETLRHEGDVEAQLEGDWVVGAERDYRALVHWARATGLPIAFISYPLDEIGVAGLVNRALRAATSAEDVPLIDSAASVARIPREEQNFLWAAHPDGRMYGEIARDVLPVVLELRPPEE